jgi:hypothetical protein
MVKEQQHHNQISHSALITSVSTGWPSWTLWTNVSKASASPVERKLGNALIPSENKSFTEAASALAFCVGIKNRLAATTATSQYFM